MPKPIKHFRLIPRNRNVPDAQLLSDLSRVAGLLNATTLTQSTYRQKSRYNPLTLTMRFGNWNTALQKAGLHPSRHFRVSLDKLLTDLQQTAAKLNTSRLTASAYISHGTYSLPVIYRHYTNWPNAVIAAGLKPSDYHPRLSYQALLDNLDLLWQHYHRQPTCLELKPPLSRFGLTPYQRRFGGFQNALQAFITWKQTNKLPPPKPKTKRKTSRCINWRLRFMVLRRDHYKCQACGQSPASDANIKLQIDHIIPLANGGETIESNLQTLCTQCNIGKSNLPM